MPTPPVVPARALRGLAVAAVGLSVAIGGHLYAGGGAAPTPSVVVVGLLVSAGCVLASDRRWSVARVLTALLAMQVAVHLALWFDGGARTADVRLSALAATAGGPHEHVTGGATSPGMVLAHLLAVAVAALLLAGADRALTALVALARRLFGTWIVAPGVRPTPTVTGARRTSVVELLELGAVGRRGPPPAPAPA